MAEQPRGGRGPSWWRSWRWCRRGCGAGWRCTRRCGSSWRSSWTSDAARSRGSRPGTGSSPTSPSPPMTSARPSQRLATSLRTTDPGSTTRCTESARSGTGRRKL
uniref:Uncharacterized protein n=1 Tax=Arundo donax TaxID=35708 RepID=A0A0A9GA63_ARUDO